MRWARIVLGAGAALSLLASCFSLCACGGKQQVEVTPPEEQKAAVGMEGHQMGQPFTPEELARMKEAAESRRPK